MLGCAGKGFSLIGKVLAYWVYFDSMIRLFSMIHGTRIVIMVQCIMFASNVWSYTSSTGLSGLSLSSLHRLTLATVIHSPNLAPARLDGACFRILIHRDELLYIFSPLRGLAPVLPYNIIHEHLHLPCSWSSLRHLLSNTQYLEVGSSDVGWGGTSDDCNFTFVSMCVELGDLPCAGCAGEELGFFTASVEVDDILV